LSEKKREHLACLIRENALSWAVASVSAEEIDRINILQASLLAMQRAVEQLSHRPDEVQADGCTARA
jgi:ribonuclease HII